MPVVEATNYLAPMSTSSFLSYRKNRDKALQLEMSLNRSASKRRRRRHTASRLRLGDKTAAADQNYNQAIQQQQQLPIINASRWLVHERLCGREDNGGDNDDNETRQQVTSEFNYYYNGSSTDNATSAGNYCSNVLIRSGCGGTTTTTTSQLNTSTSLPVPVMRTRLAATKMANKRRRHAKTLKLLGTTQASRLIMLQVALISLAAIVSLVVARDQPGTGRSGATAAVGATGAAIGARNSTSSQSMKQSAANPKVKPIISNTQMVFDLNGAVSKQQTFQLQRSADVELTRRSLQRLQRDASSTPSGASSADASSSVVVAAAAASASASASAATSSTPTSTCGYPGSPAHASVTFNTSHVVAGTAASYTCDNGYELLGPPRRICQSNGTWSPVGIPFCVLNVGLGKAAMQSSTAGHGSAQKAVDGSTSPYFQASTCTMTDVENNPWWYVNLLEPYLVQIVRIDFGTACCANRQKATIAVRVGNNRPDLGTNPLCNRYHGFIEEGKPLFLPCTRPAPGAFVSIHLESPNGSALSICETFIYTDHALSIEQCPSFRDQPLGSTATYNGKCYLFHNNQALNFDGARKYCESRGGTLVDETSPALQGFLSWELYRRHRNDQLMGQYWLGAVRDARNQQNWKWINGRDVQISFWNSLANQGNCSRFDGSKGWLWSDTDCQAQLNYICQYRPLSCGKPEKPTNSTLLTKNIDNGTVIEYQCSPGSLLMGPKSRVCLPTGFFSEFAPKCKYLDCQFPAQIANGDYKLLNGTTAYQSVVTYYCNDGYQLYGRSTLTCDVDERWNGPPPRCEPLLCPAPVAPSNGYVTVTSNITTPGTQATYDCRPGYELVGDRLLSCLQSGSWDNSFPYCKERRQVPPLTLQVNGSPQAGNGQAVAAAAASGGGGQQLAANNSGGQNNGGNRPPPSSGGSRQNAQVGPRQQQQSASSIQFPSQTNNVVGNVGLFSSNRVVPTSSAVSSTTSASQSLSASSNAPSSLPASLNGLAGQFVTPPTFNGPTSSSSTSSSSGQSSTSAATQQPPAGVSSNEIQVTPQTATTAGTLASGQSLQQQQPASSFGDQNQVYQLNRKPAMQQNASAASSASNNNNYSDLHLQTPIIKPQLPSRGPQMSGTSNQVAPARQQPQQQQQAAGSQQTLTASGNKFTLSPQQQHQHQQQQQSSSLPTNSIASGGQQQQSSSYDSSPLATTNSISVHQPALVGATSGQQHHVHQNQQQHQQPQQMMPTTSGPHSTSTAATSFSNMSPISSTMSTTAAAAATTTNGYGQLSSSTLSANSAGNQLNVLASLANGPSSTSGSSIRNGGGGGGGNFGGNIGSGAHLHGHSLASAKYSLDGIIAVAIFGGFIFLGAIITILVIIVRRRKSSQSSCIDAQTISTYDSNGGEHNGLYRNYQQAWENLRFAAPGSQPKSSGNGPPPPPHGSANSTGGGVGGGPLSMGMKSYASPAGIAMLHHAHPIHTTSALASAAAAGHHNLGMSSSSTTSSSSQSSSSLAVTGPAGSGGADPLLGPHHHSSSARHHHQQQQQQLHVSRAHAGYHAHELANHAHVYHHDDDVSVDEDDHDEDDDEQGVISADEATNYSHHQHQLTGLNGSSVHRMHALAGSRQHHHHQQQLHHLHQQQQQQLHQAHLNEGFRDSNELTINADTATLASATNGQAATALNQATRRRLYSTNSMAAAAGASAAATATHTNRRSLANLTQADAHPRSVGGGGGGQVHDSNGSSSNSTRSSRASPPSDDHSLDRLAYGNNWHNHNPNGSGGQ